MLRALQSVVTFITLPFGEFTFSLNTTERTSGVADQPLYSSLLTQMTVFNT